MGPELYPHQQEALNKMHNGCILAGKMGVGKSIVAAAYYVRNEAPRDVYVITTAKKRDALDWVGEFLAFGVGREQAYSPSVGRLVVDSWNNIGKYKDVKDAFFVFDEQRLVGSGHWTKSFVAIAKANRWILLSATPGDTWLDYIPVFVANGFYKNRTEFKREHVIYSTYTRFPKVERYIGVGRLVRHRNSILVEMPYVSHTKWITKEIEVDYDRELFDEVVKKRWHVYENRPLRDVAELFSVMRKVVNSDTTRLKAVQKLLDSHPKLIVFYNFDYELEMLHIEWDIDANLPLYTRDYLRGAKNDRLEHFLKDGLVWVRDTESGEVYGGFPIAEWNGHRRQAIPSSDTWVYLVQYAAGSEGWNCVETDAMCFYSLTYSYKMFHQAHGRIDRMNTPYTNLYYYILKSKSVIDLAIWRSLREKKNFDERRFVDIVA